MSEHDHPGQKPDSKGGLWQSRAGILLVFSLAVAALLLGYEHRVHLFAGDAYSAVLLLAFVAMHFFMHRGHGGGHGGHKDRDAGDKP